MGCPADRKKETEKNDTRRDPVSVTGSKIATTTTAIKAQNHLE